MSENISAPQGSTQLIPDMALDERLYDLTEDERTFFKQQTGIQNDDELKAHLFQVQAEAYEVCIPLKYISSAEMKKKKKFHQKNRFILTLAFASSISQSEFSPEKKNRIYNAESSVAEIGIFIKIPPTGSRCGVCPRIRTCLRKANHAGTPYF
jgi:hypothetical protein